MIRVLFDIGPSTITTAINENITDVREFEKTLDEIWNKAKIKIVKDFKKTYKK